MRIIEAFKLLGWKGNGLMFGLVLIGVFLFWSSLVATPGQGVGCLTGSCDVSQQAVQATRLEAYGVWLLAGLSWTAALVTISWSLDYRDRNLGQKQLLVSTQDFWKKIE